MPFPKVSPCTNGAGWPTWALRSFFFEETVLSHTWFDQHLKEAHSAAGPRYTPDLTVETELWKWFDAFGITPAWRASLKTLLCKCSETLQEMARSTEAERQDALMPAWPEELRADGKSCWGQLSDALDSCSSLASTLDLAMAQKCVEQISDSLDHLGMLEKQLASYVDAEYGAGRADSPGFRQWHAEYMCSWPTAHLDNVREMLSALSNLMDWLRSPAGWFAFEPAMLLMGAAGSGKTHGVCDTAARRFRDDRLSVIVFGHQFGGEPEIWTRLREILGLPATLGRDGMLDALNSAGEASGYPLLLWIDAINETRPFSYWRDRLMPVVETIKTRPFIRVCLTCRTAFAAHCVPTGVGIREEIHRGFAGVQSQACRAFFDYYGLKPPVAPLLQPELTNPLYLKLVCQTLKSRGCQDLPVGWWGLNTSIQAFLNEKDHQFALARETQPGAQYASNALQSIAMEIALAGETGLIWSRAEHLLQRECPRAATMGILEWLVREDLLIEDALPASDALDGQMFIRPAFERLGEFLVAKAALSGLCASTLLQACQPEGKLYRFFESVEAIDNYAGMIAAMALLVPEDTAPGVELPDLLSDGDVRRRVLEIAVASYPWRDPSSFGNATERNLRQVLSGQENGFEAMDAVLAVSCQVSALDAHWLHNLLSARQMSARDPFWCTYLHDRFEALGPVSRLIQSASELSLEQVPLAVAERWAIVLLWFTAAADRRVKDQATRAATALLHVHACLGPRLAQQFMMIDDDAVRERVLLVAYGACILSGDRVAIGELCQVLADALADNTAFHQALLRDHARSIAEWASRMGQAEVAKSLVKRLDELRSPWPLSFPTDAQIKDWERLPRLVQSCLRDDFFTYSMRCLDKWNSAIPEEALGKWILHRVAKDFGYAKSACGDYDSELLNAHGGGRGKPVWAERIGKKYQWIAMYQLAARLSDHVKLKRNDWDPKPLRKPLILIEERQMDPTLPQKFVRNRSSGSAWWIPMSLDLGAPVTLSDDDWTQKRDDVPDIGQFACPFRSGDVEWRLIMANLAKKSRPEEAAHDVPYRYMWIQLRAYLVGKTVCKRAFALLNGRNFFGRWMPEGASWLHGFVGEYPWGAAYNTESEEWHRRGRSMNGLPFQFIPAVNEVVAEWEYDASLADSARIQVPSRLFFEVPGHLAWTGRDGFKREDGRAVFRDPSLTERGPSALVADNEDLLRRLTILKKRLIITLLGEKLVHSAPRSRDIPRRTFSQVAMLNEDGALEQGRLTFFEDYAKATGPGRRQRRRRRSLE